MPTWPLPPHLFRRHAGLLRPQVRHWASRAVTCLLLSPLEVGGQTQKQAGAIQND